MCNCATVPVKDPGSQLTVHGKGCSAVVRVQQTVFDTCVVLVYCYLDAVVDVGVLVTVWVLSPCYTAYSIYYRLLCNK